MSKQPDVRWLPDVEEHDYPAAASYLQLTMAPAAAQEIVAKLRAAAVTTFKAKDIFRASGLSLLGVSNSHVVNDQRKIQQGQALSPLLLVRDPAHGRVIVADGYHRMCAVYSFNEDAEIPGKIV